MNDKPVRMKNAKLTPYVVDVNCPYCEELVASPDNDSLMWQVSDLRSGTVHRCESCGKEFKIPNAISRLVLLRKRNTNVIVTPRQKEALIFYADSVDNDGWVFDSSFDPRTVTSLKKRGYIEFCYDGKRNGFGERLTVAGKATVEILRTQEGKTNK